MAGNNSLGAAKDARQDEFYTQISDIENELRHYRKHFKDKTVLCNCDDPFESNFFKYFVLNFNRLGLKKLIATCYSGSPIAGTQLSLFEDIPSKTFATPYKAVVTVVRDVTGDGGIGMDDVAELFRTGENKLTRLKGNGDFRSRECLDILDEADIVVTNPPFSVFDEYLLTLIEYKKKFVVLGRQTAFKYKSIFPLIVENKVWAGFGFNLTLDFRMPDTYEMRGKAYYADDGTKHGFVPGICWLTNLDIKKRHEEMVLVKEYNPDEYLHYTNFDGIDVPSIRDIPCDYPGNMGVPINFLDEYNPDQFEIVGLGEGNLAKEAGVTKNKRGRTDLEVEDPPGTFRRPFARIIIRNRHPESPED